MFSKSNLPGKGSIPSPTTRDIASIALIALAYFAACRIALFFPDAQRVLVTVWPAGGIGLAALLLSPRRRWPAICTALFVAGNAANLLSGRPPLNSLGFMTANVLESLGCAWLIVRWCGEHVTFRTVKGIAALMCAATVVNACTAAIGAGTAAIASVAPFWGYWQTWWVSDGLGILLVTPLIFNWSGLRPWPRFAWRQLAEFSLVMGAWCVLADLTFRVMPGASPFMVPPYLLFPFLAFIALRLGLCGATTAVFLLAALAVTSSAVSIGPLPWVGVTPTNRLLAVQTFLACAAGTGLVLAASFAESRSSERAARDEQARFQTLGNNLPNGMVYEIVRDFDGAMRFAYLSAGVERLCGVAAQAVLRDPATFYGLVVEEDRARLAAAEEASARLMEPMEAVVRLRRPDGQMRWLRLASSPRRLPDGRILWDGIQIDVTERQTALRSLSRWAQVFAHAGWGIAVGSDDGKEVLLANPAFAAIHGYSAADLAGRPFLDLFAQEAREEAERQLVAACESGHGSWEAPHLRKDGSAFPVLIDIAQVRDDEETPPYTVINVLDITGRKKAETQSSQASVAKDAALEALRASEERFRTLLEQAPFPLILTRAGRHVYVNRAFVRMLGLQARKRQLAAPSRSI